MALRSLNRTNLPITRNVPSSLVSQRRVRVSAGIVSVSEVTEVFGLSLEINQQCLVRHWLRSVSCTGVNIWPFSFLNRLADYSTTIDIVT